LKSEEDIKSILKSNEDEKIEENESVTSDFEFGKKKRNRLIYLNIIY
jgi:hypothetical protein